MANRYQNPVQFAMEPNVVFLSAHVTFGATGVPTLDNINSKGICNFAVDTVTFNANSVGSSATLSSVTSFAGLFVGQTVSGAVSGTIASITAASGLITLASGTGVPTSNAGVMFVNTGRYRVQFGTQAAVRLDSYYKFLGLSYSWDMSASSASGGALVQALSPAASDVFMVQNNTRVRTIPRTSTSGSTDCSLVLEVGSQSNQNVFTAVAPVAGSGLRIVFVFGNSSAV